MVRHVPLCRQMANFLVDVMPRGAPFQKKKEKKKKGCKFENRITFAIPKNGCSCILEEKERKEVSINHCTYIMS